MIDKRIGEVNQRIDGLRSEVNQSVSDRRGEMNHRLSGVDASTQQLNQHHIDHLSHHQS